MDCVVCCEEYNEEKEERLPCLHPVHLSCVKKHFKPECPVCRRPLNIKVEGKHPEPDASLDPVQEDGFLINYGFLPEELLLFPRQNRMGVLTFETFHPPQILYGDLDSVYVQGMLMEDICTNTGEDVEDEEDDRDAEDEIDYENCHLYVRQREE